MGLLDFAEGLGDQVKKLFTRREVSTVNLIFNLHQQWTFIFILVGLIFATGNNYLNSKAIVCVGNDQYHNDFCFVHGGTHVAKDLQSSISSSTQCETEATDYKEKKGSRTTSYYIWLPFVLGSIAIITKMPGILWHNFLERDVMDKLVKDMDENGSKAAERFFKVSKRRGRLPLQAAIYNLGFALCEILNFVAILVNGYILHSVLNKEFASYGIGVQNHKNYVPPGEALAELPPSDRIRPTNPMCKLFPTEISCDVSMGGIAGPAKKDNLLCLLPNNMFYQYYFLILWWWWAALIIVSFLGIVYRLAQICVPQFGRMRLTAVQKALGVSQNHGFEKNLKQWDIFLLTRLVGNLKGSQVIELFEALEREPEESEEPDESATLLNSANREDHVPESFGVIVHHVPDELS